MRIPFELRELSCWFLLLTGRVLSCKSEAECLGTTGIITGEAVYEMENENEDDYFIWGNIPGVV